MGNLVQITEKDGIYVNSTKINHVLSWHLDNPSYSKVMTMSIEFDVGEIEMLEHAPEISPIPIEISTDVLVKELKAILTEHAEDDEEFWEAPSKQEILEDFSNNELIQELERRNVLKLVPVSQNLFFVQGSLFRPDSDD